MRSVSKIAPKSPFLRVNKSPIRYSFKAGAKAIRYNVNKAFIDILHCFKDLVRNPGGGVLPNMGYIGMPQRVGFFSRFGHKLGIDFGYFAAILVINRVTIFAL